MSIRNWEPDLNNRLWAHLALIVTTIVTALVLGYGVGLAVSGKPESAGIAVMPPGATHRVRSTATPVGTPTLPATNTPAAALGIVTAAPPVTKSAAAASTPAPAKAAPSSNALSSILPTVTPSSRAAAHVAAGTATPEPPTPQTPTKAD